MAAIAESSIDITDDRLAARKRAWDGGQRAGVSGGRHSGIAAGLGLAGSPAESGMTTAGPCARAN
jgi:hypothetical protein